MRDAIARAGGLRLSDGFISPLDLVEIGLVTAEEAQQLHAIETSGRSASGLSSHSRHSRTIGAAVFASRRAARRTSRRVARRR